MMLDEVALDHAGFPSRLRVFRLVGLAMPIGLIIVTCSIVGVVQMALGGIPLAGNAVQFAGRPVASWVGLALAVQIPLIAWFVHRALLTSGVRRVAQDRTLATDTTAEYQQLLEVYGGAKFVEMTMIEGIGFVCAILYHLTADPAIIGLVIGLVSYMVWRVPTRSAVRSWLESALETVADSRSQTVV
ncbi:MAG: hypothetical protein LC104_07055 [Bacteroidales bacterium]|nr:hypothetical protein [Bacteroidales bacterium]